MANRRAKCHLRNKKEEQKLRKIVLTGLLKPRKGKRVNLGLVNQPERDSTSLGDYRVNNMVKKDAIKRGLKRLEKHRKDEARANMRKGLPRKK